MSVVVHTAVADRDTLGGLVAWATAALSGCSASPRLDAELLLARAADTERSSILAFPERRVGVDARREFLRLVSRRRDAVPLAYLTGMREFYSLELAVTPHVLVPRPETELVVDTALEMLEADATADVLDLGTGSGAIAAAIKHARPRVRVTAVELESAALAVARCNAAALDIPIDFVQSDWFSALGGQRYDLIVANPPYVSSGDPMLRGTLRHEPLVALDGGPDGLDAIRSIVAVAPGHLRAGGALIVEHGDEHGERVRRLAAACGLRDPQTLRDLSGRDRVLLASR